MTLASKLQKIQAKIAAPKDQFNKFGGFAYRNAEGILGALKPLLDEQKVVLLMSEKPIEIGDRIYIGVTVSLHDAESDAPPIMVTSLAREAEEKKGMDAAQVTGSAISYARKYALCAMFAIGDSTDDPDAQEGTKGITHGTREKLAAVALKKNISPQNMTAIMSAEFKVNKSADLTETQGRALLKILNEMAAN